MAMAMTAGFLASAATGLALGLNGILASQSWRHAAFVGASCTAVQSTVVLIVRAIQ